MMAKPIRLYIPSIKEKKSLVPEDSLRNRGFFDKLAVLI
jgi:hypothetical protein